MKVILLSSVTSCSQNSGSAGAAYLINIVMIYELQEETHFFPTCLSEWVFHLFIEKLNKLHLLIWHDTSVIIIHTQLDSYDWIKEVLIYISTFGLPTYHSHSGILKLIEHLGRGEKYEFGIEHLLFLLVTLGNLWLDNVLLIYNVPLWNVGLNPWPIVNVWKYTIILY